MLDLIRCPRCAKQIPDVSRFCRRCGCATLIGVAVPPPPPVPARIVPPLPPRPRREPARRTARPTAPARQSGGAMPWVMIVFAVFMGMNVLRSARHANTPATPAPVPAVRWNVVAPPPPVRVAPEPPARQRPKAPAHVGPYSFEP